MRLGLTVYILRSRSGVERFYVGITRDSPGRRIRQHNAGTVPHTARFRPWDLKAAFWFADEDTAFAFERYLKSGSGRAFAKRHF